MKRFLTLFFLVFTILLSPVKAQNPVEPDPISVNENTATETVVTYSQYVFRSLTIIADPTGRFMESRVIINAGLVKQLTDLDPITGYHLYEPALDDNNRPIEVEIFRGKLSEYLQLLQDAQNATVITETDKNNIIAGQLEIYQKAAQGLLTTANIKVALGRLELKAKKVTK